MPRCMMNTVRGYRGGKYWGCEADSQNVMKTRSGRVISTIPKLRPATAANRAAASYSRASLPGKLRDSYKSSRIMDYKPMSCMSFVTRFRLIKEGIPLHLNNEDSDTDDWLDYTAPYPMLHDHTSSDTTSSIACKGDQNKDKSDCVQSSLKTNAVSVNNKEHSFDAHPPTARSYVYHEKTGEVKNKDQAKSLANYVNYIYLHIAKGEGRRSKVKHTTGVAPTNCAVVKPPRAGFKPSLADRHPVLLQCISRADARDTANAAASLLSLAAGGSKQTPASQSIKPKKTNTAVPFHGFQPPNRVDNNNLGTSSATDLVIEEEEDNCSIASQSSADESYVRQASECDSSFKHDLGRFQVESHAYAIDASGNKIHRCTICDKVFTVITAFRVHVNTHVRPKNRCGVCGKIFSRSWLLKGHMRTHTGERPYTCRYAGCDRRFADKSNLRSHTLIHTTKDKGHVCTKCKRAFAQKRYLHKHKLEVCLI